MKVTEQATNDNANVEIAEVVRRGDNVVAYDKAGIVIEEYTGKDSVGLREKLMKAASETAKFVVFVGGCCCNHKETVSRELW